jgi:arylformamidase
MKAFFDFNSNRIEVDLKNPIDISIPLVFNEKQPNTFDIDFASSEPCRVGDFVGDTRLGGSCNFEKISFVPHCNGTHTECIGHITDERVYINRVLKDSFIPSTLITVMTSPFRETTDTYCPNFSGSDNIISRKHLKDSLLHTNHNFLKGLIIRTIPNDESKKTRRYSKEEAPFFSIEAIELICELGIEHLLVDFPSLDRAFDDGKLTAHHIYWNIAKETHHLNHDSRIFATITEMVYIDKKIADGNYMLNLQIAPFESDASPSRPIIYEVK